MTKGILYVLYIRDEKCGSDTLKDYCMCRGNRIGIDNCLRSNVLRVQIPLPVPDLLFSR